jgi:hypothetical protein
VFLAGTVIAPWTCRRVKEKGENAVLYLEPSRTLITEKEIHAAWNCMWVRVGHPFVRIQKPDQPDDAWLCVRPPVCPRYVTDEECSRCKFWESDISES